MSVMSLDDADVCNAKRPFFSLTLLLFPFLNTREIPKGYRFHKQLFETSGG